MSIEHNGFTFECDINMLRHSPPRDAPNPDAWRCRPFKTYAETERTAIAHAREEGWQIVTIRVTKGAPASEVRSVKRVLCPACAWLVGL